MNTQLVGQKIVTTVREVHRNFAVYEPVLDDGATGPYHYIELARDTYDEMGGPDVVTVTFEIGDTLNEDTSEGGSV